MPANEDKLLYISDLAKRVWLNFKPVTDESKKRGYYMLNINHPVIRSLADRYKVTKGIPVQYAMDDLQRVEFELMLLNGPTLNLIESTCQQAEKTKDKK